MPIYDYVCGSCGHVVEVIHAISAAGPSVCERCGGTMKRALSTPAIVFKGSGWAKKDARDAGRAKATPKAATEGASTGEATSPASTGGEGTSGSDAANPSSGPSAAKDSPTTTASTTATSGGSDPAPS